MALLDVADLDTIFLTFDEPKKEEFWAKISSDIPWALRVDGVKGSDAAHKAAAQAGNTDWFVLIDGDHMPDLTFFNQQFQTPEVPSAFRWKARNAINGLMYGNGGISIWHKEFVMNMRTHEASDGSADTAVEFCYDENYHAMWNVYGTTHPNQSDFHAWRAGFREGVKMCLNKGVRPSLEEFDQMIHNKNLDNLMIWLNVGADADHGTSAMDGALFGLHAVMLTEWDYTGVQNFDALKMQYDGYEANVNADTADEYINATLDIVKNRLNIPLIRYTKDQSKFFKHFYIKTQHNVDFMTKEIDVIRQRENW